MQDRGERRARTENYARRARRVWLRQMCGVRNGNFPDHPVGWFAKGKAIGCRCLRHAKGRPKVAGSLCHGGSCYHPSVVERIRGNRLVRAWKRELRAEDALDVEL